MDLGYFSRTNTSTILNKQTFFFSHNLKSEKKSSIIVQFAECLLHLRGKKTNSPNFSKEHLPTLCNSFITTTDNKTNSKLPKLLLMGI